MAQDRLHYRIEEDAPSKTPTKKRREDTTEPGSSEDPADEGQEVDPRTEGQEVELHAVVVDAEPARTGDDRAEGVISEGPPPTPATAAPTSRGYVLHLTDCLRHRAMLDIENAVTPVLHWTTHRKLPRRCWEKAGSFQVSYLMTKPGIPAL